MGPSWNFRFIARVLGNPAVMAAGILSFPWLVGLLVYSDAAPWLTLVISAMYAVPVLGGVGYRLCKGGEQGATDITIHQTMTSRTVTIGNVPLTASTVGLHRAMETFSGLTPIPRSAVAGIVHGSPAQFANVEPDAKAELPEHVPVTDQAVGPPEGAQGLLVEVSDSLSATDQKLAVEKEEPPASGPRQNRE
jgi:hypothetical protein